ncbi:MAG: hypothetical protein ABIH89_00365, partial [Elusimicrobiota bacterium]
PYIGAGISPVEYKYEEYTEDWLNTKNVSYEESKVGLGLVINGGVNLFNFSKYRITMDMKLLLGGKYKNYNTHIRSFSGGIASTW